MRLDERKSAGSRIARRAIRRSDRHRGWLRSNLVARERHEADHGPITPSIWGRSGQMSAISAVLPLKAYGRRYIDDPGRCHILLNLHKSCPRGTEGSNPSLSSSESQRTVSPRSATSSSTRIACIGPGPASDNQVNHPLVAATCSVPQLYNWADPPTDLSPYYNRRFATLSYWQDEASLIHLPNLALPPSRIHETSAAVHCA